MPLGTHPQLKLRKPSASGVGRGLARESARIVGAAILG